jgi:hypothetical protein
MKTYYWEMYHVENCQWFYNTTKLYWSWPNLILISLYEAVKVLNNVYYKSRLYVKIHVIFDVQSILCSVILRLGSFSTLCHSRFSHSTFCHSTFSHSKFSHSTFSHSMLNLSMFGHSMLGHLTLSLLTFSRWIIFLNCKPVYKYNWCDQNPQGTALFSRTRP